MEGFNKSENQGLNTDQDESHFWEKMNEEDQNDFFLYVLSNRSKDLIVFKGYMIISRTPAWKRWKKKYDATNLCFRVPTPTSSDEEFSEEKRTRLERDMTKILQQRKLEELHESIGNTEEEISTSENFQETGSSPMNNEKDFLILSPRCGARFPNHPTIELPIIVQGSTNATLPIAQQSKQRSPSPSSESESEFHTPRMLFNVRRTSSPISGFNKLIPEESHLLESVSDYNDSDFHTPCPSPSPERKQIGIPKGKQSNSPKKGKILKNKEERVMEKQTKILKKEMALRGRRRVNNIFTLENPGPSSNSRFVTPVHSGENLSLRGWGDGPSDHLALRRLAIASEPNRRLAEAFAYKPPDEQILESRFHSVQNSEDSETETLFDEVVNIDEYNPTEDRFGNSNYGEDYYVQYPVEEEPEMQEKVTSDDESETLNSTLNMEFIFSESEDDHEITITQQRGYEETFIAHRFAEVRNSYTATSNYILTSETLEAPPVRVDGESQTDFSLLSPELDLHQISSNSIHYTGINEPPFQVDVETQTDELFIDEELLDYNSLSPIFESHLEENNSSETTTSVIDFIFYELSNIFEGAQLTEDEARDEIDEYAVFPEEELLGSNTQEHLSRNARCTIPFDSNNEAVLQQNEASNNLHSLSM